MKTYEKPTLTLLSVSANDMLCTGCSTKWTPDGLLAWLETIGFPTNEYDNAFTSNESCSCPVDDYSDNVMYCKFTGSDQIFTS